MPAFDTKTYISPFTWRYGSPQMRHIFSEQHKYELWRKIWVSLAEAQHTSGLVSKDELEDLKTHQNEIDIERILEIERDTKHDVVAAIREFAEKAKKGGGKIHLGLTSMDVVDNTEVIRFHEGLTIIEDQIKTLLGLLKEKIEKYADTVCLGYTHLQPAEPTTVGYRFAFYAQDLLMDLELLKKIKDMTKGKGIKGAVGTQASFVSLLSSFRHPERSEGSHSTNNVSIERDSSPSVQNDSKDARDTAIQLEKEVMKKLGIGSLDISTQVYTRKIDFLVMTVLVSIASSVAKFAADLRILQNPMIGEWSEPFGKSQVGSSAMPFKKNPISSEKICSLARMIEAFPTVALENATHSYLERTLDDSANRRVFIPETFLAVDEILATAGKILPDMVINTDRIARNLATFAPFVASEGIMMQAVKKGANRQEMHEILREAAMAAWKHVVEGRENPMKDILMENPKISEFLSKEDLEKQMDVSSHVGTAAKRAGKIAQDIESIK